MNLKSACAEAERLSTKHKDTEFVVIINDVTKGIERYQVALREELAHRAKLYVPVKCYLNGKAEEYK